MQLFQIVIITFLTLASADVKTMKTSDFQVKAAQNRPTAIPSSRRPTKSPTITPTSAPVSTTYSCPPKSYISQINANVGAIVDRFNFRCNDAKHSQSQDIGAPLSTVTSPKSSVLMNSNGFDSISVGYGWYGPVGQLVVTSLRVCNGIKCQESFFYGLTICSADSSQTYACPTIHIFSAPPGQKITGIVAIHNPTKKYGYVKQLDPIFS